MPKTWSGISTLPPRLTFTLTGTGSGGGAGSSGALRFAGLPGGPKVISARGAERTQEKDQQRKLVRRSAFQKRTKAPFDQRRIALGLSSGLKERQTHSARGSVSRLFHIQVESARALFAEHGPFPRGGLTFSSAFFLSASNRGGGFGSSDGRGDGSGDGCGFVFWGRGAGCGTVAAGGELWRRA